MYMQSKCLCLLIYIVDIREGCRFSMSLSPAAHQRHMGKLSCTAGAPCCVLIGPCSPLPRHQMPSHEIWIQISQHVVLIENKPKPEKTQNPTQLQREKPPSDHAVNFYFPIPLPDPVALSVYASHAFSVPPYHNCWRWSRFSSATGCFNIHCQFARCKLAMISSALHRRTSAVMTKSASQSMLQIKQRKRSVFVL